MVEYGFGCIGLSVPLQSHTMVDVARPRTVRRPASGLGYLSPGFGSTGVLEARPRTAPPSSEDRSEH